METLTQEIDVEIQEERLKQIRQFEKGLQHLISMRNKVGRLHTNNGERSYKYGYFILEGESDTEVTQIIGSYSEDFRLVEIQFNSNDVLRNDGTLLNINKTLKDARKWFGNFKKSERLFSHCFSATELLISQLQIHHLDLDNFIRIHSHDLTSGSQRLNSLQLILPITDNGLIKKFQNLLHVHRCEMEFLRHVISKNIDIKNFESL